MQVLYHLSHLTLPGLALNHDPPTSDFRVAEIAGVHHCA
jgi:hypothetical protein